ncbi:MAG: hypothetical protein PHQ01_04355, partial [Candidatus Pacebacteria bacterium]|nr:hypothetical protein [Candidatus Paceibacterota bacterium]
KEKLLSGYFDPQFTFTNLQTGEVTTGDNIQRLAIEAESEKLAKQLESQVSTGKENIYLPLKTSESTKLDSVGQFDKSLMQKYGSEMIKSIGEAGIQTGQTIFFNPKGEFDFYMTPKKTNNIIGDSLQSAAVGALMATPVGMVYGPIKNIQRLYEYEQAEGTGLDRFISEASVATTLLGGASGTKFLANIAKGGGSISPKATGLNLIKETLNLNKKEAFDAINAGLILTSLTDKDLSSESKITTAASSLAIGGVFGGGSKILGSVMPKVLGGITKTKTVTTGGIVTESTMSLWDKLNTPLITGKSTVGKILTPITTPITTPLTAMGGLYGADVIGRISSSDDKVKAGINIYTTEILPMFLGAKIGYGVTSRIGDAVLDFKSVQKYLKTTQDKVKFSDIGKYIRENTLPETASDPMIAIFDTKNLQPENVRRSFELNQHFPDFPINAPKGYTNEPSRSSAMTEILAKSKEADEGTLLMYHATPYGQSFKGETVVGIGSSENWGLYTAARPQAYYSKVDPSGKTVKFSLFGGFPNKQPTIIGVLAKEAKVTPQTKNIGKWSDLTSSERTKINVDIYKSLEGLPSTERVYSPRIKAEKEWIIAPNTILSDVPMKPQWYTIEGRRVPFQMKQITSKKSLQSTDTKSTELIINKKPSKITKKNTDSSYGKNVGDLSVSNLLGSMSLSKEISSKLNSSSKLKESSKLGSSSVFEEYFRFGESSKLVDSSKLVSSSKIEGSSKLSESSKRDSSSITGGYSIQTLTSYKPLDSIINPPTKTKVSEEKYKVKKEEKDQSAFDFWKLTHKEISSPSQMLLGKTLNIDVKAPDVEFVKHVQTQWKTNSIRKETTKYNKNKSFKKKLKK